MLIFGYFGMVKISWDGIPEDSTFSINHYKTV
jgi:hypothetical protein